MMPPIRIAPDGAQALAALLANRGGGPLTPAFAVALEDAAVRADANTTLGALYARRRQHHLPSEATGRSLAARFVRRQHRRWRVTQAPDFISRLSTDTLERAGRRALRRGAGWPDATPLAVGVWHAFWVLEDPRGRRDLLALLPLADARRVAQRPLDPEQARRFWR